MTQHEEDTTIGARWSWAIILAFCAAIVAWGLANYRWIADAPRQWDFGALPDAPGQSIYSTAAAPADVPQPPPQIAPLPGARRTSSTRPAAATGPASAAAQSRPEGRP